MRNGVPFSELVVVTDHLQVGVRGGRYPETDPSRHSVARVECLQLATEQMRGEAETAGVLVEDRHQVIGDNVLVRVLRNGIIGHCDKYGGNRAHQLSLPPSPCFALHLTEIYRNLP